MTSGCSVSRDTGKNRGKMRYKGIFITGCPHSGTHLLLRLFYAFEDVNVIPTETGPGHIVKVEHPGITVGKNVGTFLEQIHARPDWQKGLRVVYIVRDGRDAMRAEWIPAMKDYERFNHLVFAVVRYEDLCRDPDHVQKFLEKRLELKSKPGTYFSDYPEFVPQSAFDIPAHDPEPYKPRPISTDRIGKDWTWYENMSGAGREEMDKYLKQWGYI